MVTDSAPGTTRVSNTSLKTTLVLAGITGAFILYVAVLSTARLAGAEPLPGWAHGSILGAFILAAVATELVAIRADRSEMRSEIAEIESRYQKLVSDVMEQRRADAQVLLRNQHTIIAKIDHAHARPDALPVEEHDDPVQLDRPRAARQRKRSNGQEPGPAAKAAKRSFAAGYVAGVRNQIKGEGGVVRELRPGRNGA